MDPRGDENDFITHYNYYPVQGSAANMSDFFRGGGGQAIPLHPDDVVHFRFSLDPDNPLKGRSPLKSVLREVFTDDEAANFTASLLRNMGVPGLIVSPNTEPASEEDTPSRRRSTSSARSPATSAASARDERPDEASQQFGFSPNDQLNLKELRRIPEERVTAVLGIPAVVAGLGAGLDRSTFTNMG
jgi:phage portal protein BeeE